MSTINITNARKNLYKLLNDVNETSCPVTIMNSRGKNAVLISEDDWHAIQETLHLVSMPGMAESIAEGLNTALEDCVEENEVEW